MAEPHDAIAPLNRGRMYASARSGVPMASSRSRARLGRTAVERARQRTDRPHDGRPQVGAGRRDDPSGEGRGVEAVVDGQDHVLLDGAGVLPALGTWPVNM